MTAISTTTISPTTSSSNSVALPGDSTTATAAVFAAYAYAGDDDTPG